MKSGQELSFISSGTNVGRSLYRTKEDITVSVDGACAFIKNERTHEEICIPPENINLLIEDLKSLEIY